MDAADHTILQGIIVLIACALFAATLFRHLHLPPILGYLLVGIGVGPFGIGLVSSVEHISEIAEFGVVFLMFTIGLEFSVAKLMAMKKVVIGLGGLQVLIITAITTGIVMLDGSSVAMGLTIGGIMAMSSTAIVIKQLKDQLEFNTNYGHNALGILLFQDLAVVAFLILIPSLSGDDPSAIYIALSLALVKAIAVIIFILLAGRWVLRPLFHIIAGTKSLELFTLAVLLVALSSALLTEALGLSMALGAFVAGMMLGETQFRHQIEVEIRPFRDVLLGLFFISIGMLLNLHSLPDIWIGVLVLLATIIVFKAGIIALITRMMGEDTPSSVQTGLILAHGGEFGFALLTIAMSDNLLEAPYNQIVLAALVFSMALSPFLIRYNRAITRFILPKTAEQCINQTRNNIKEAAENLSEHIIICGFGRAGQNFARLMELEGFSFIALDMDPERVQQAQLAGESVSYGDSTNLQMLVAAGLAKAKALVISHSDLAAAHLIVTQVRDAYPDLPILVRTDDDAELQQLQDEGATEVIPDTLESSLTLAFHAFILMGIPFKRAYKTIQLVRSNHYDLLHQVFPDYAGDASDELESPRELLHAVELTPGAHAIDKSLADIDFKSCNVTVTAINRDNIRRPEPEPETQLQANDAIVLYGMPEDVEQAEHLLLNG